MMKERVHWIDWSKAILIYLVVVAHYGQIPTVVDNAICAFHMPAFFMISGYLHKVLPFKESVRKNIKRLLVPALMFSLLCWLLRMFQLVLQQDAFNVSEHIVKPILGFVRYDRPNVSPQCGVIWFLEVLFLCKIIIDALKGSTKAIVILSIFGLLVTVLCKWLDIGTMSWGFLFQRTCASFPFVAMGYLVRKYDGFERLSAIKWLPFVLLLLYVVGVWYNGRVGIATYRFGHSVLIWFVTAVAGSLCCFLLLSKIKFGGGKVLLNISNGTIVILCLHRVFIPYLLKLQIDPYLGSLLIVAICYPIFLFMDRYVPWFVGKSSKHK